jgi:predicted Zn-dependent protease
MATPRASVCHKVIPSGPDGNESNDGGNIAVMEFPTTAVLVVVTAFTAFAQAPSSKGLNFYSIEKEIEIGKQIAASLARFLPIIYEPKLDAYVARLRANLGERSAQGFVYRFRFYDDRVSPFRPAFPAMIFPTDALKGKPAEPVVVAGGPIFIPLSLLADADSEGEFAALLAHAMAHVALRHASRVTTRGQVTGYYIPAGTQGAAAAGLGLLTLARRFELQADEFAVGTIAEAGYDPAAMVRYLEQNRSSDSGLRSQVFSAHPTVNKRLETVNAAIRELPARTYSAGTGEFEAMKTVAGSVR